ncbi:MAG: amidohydrolase family protein, partial [Candidatus Marinimicrobia bacterium]|nr:amidohydrolase family protein [Candidatus Neomarinimicrobiota bacterium]
TKTALLELMNSGCSTSSDHLYLFPARETGELIDAQITVARDVGARFHATRGSMSLGKSNGGLPPDDTVQTEAEIQADTERLLKLYHDDGEGAMIRLALAPCSPFSVTPELMRSTVGYARVNNLHIHTHLAETLDEDKFCLNMFGKRPADYVDSLGWITDFAWFAHAIHVNDDEIKRLGDAGVGISHCPSSNMRLGSGIARIREMLNAGVKVSLGVDGSASNDGSNLLLEARQALLISRLREEDYWLTARDVLEIATRGGAAALGRNDIGQLTVGKRADLALFSVAGLEYAGAQSDPLAALIFTVRQSPVDYLLVNGEIRIRKGKSRVDEQKLVQTHNWIAQQMLEQAGRKTGIDFMKNEGKE